MTDQQNPPDLDCDVPGDVEPRWPALLAILAVAGLNLALPASLSVVRPWVLIFVIGAFLALSVVSHHMGHHDLNQFFGFVVTGIVTAAMLISLFLLVKALPTHAEAPDVMLRSAGALWGTNVLVFALWYWRLDAGGPHQRDLRPDHAHGAFLFPQMTLSYEERVSLRCGNWSPGFIDYLFLAFNASTALSPTDVAVLSPWAKILMMMQALVSLSVVALLAARAINIL